jgi:tRNA threonylcarbamoyl adenosine modification protein YeaZ
LKEKKTVLKTLFLVYSTKRRKYETKFKMKQINNTLAIAGLSEKTTVAIYSNDICLAEITIMSRDCSKLLVVAINETLSKSLLTIDDIDCITTEVGPGSFTGLRILAATVNGISHIKKIPLIGINSLTLLANQALAFQKYPEQSILVSIINAYGGQAYASIFKTSNKEPLIENLCISPEALAIELNSISKSSDLFFCGKTPDNYLAKLKLELPNRNIIFLKEELESATLELYKNSIKQVVNSDLDGTKTILIPTYVKNNFGTF